MTALGIDGGNKEKLVLLAQSNVQFGAYAKREKTRLVEVVRNDFSPSNWKVKTSTT